MSDPGRVDNISVLIIENNPGDADLIALHLSGPSPVGTAFSTIWVRTLDEAIEKLREQAPDTPDIDAIVLDLGLPDSVGLDAPRRVLAESPALPLVVMTGSDAAHLGMEAIREGCSDYLEKNHPLTLSLLPRTLLSAIERTRLKRALKERMAALERSEAAKSALLNASPDMTFRIDRDGTYLEVFANDAEELFDVPANLIGERMHKVLPREVATAWMHAIRQALDGGVAQTLAYQLSLPTGVFDHEARIAAAGPNEVVAVVRDVTQRTQLLSQLYAAERMEAIARLAGGVAHEFNNLLTVIRSLAKLVRSDVQEHPTAREDLDAILDAVTRAAALTDQLLAFGQRQNVRFEQLELNQVIRGLANTLLRFLGEDIRLEIDLGEGNIVLAAKSQIEQILIHLAVNARDAMPKGGTLTLKTKRLQLDAAQAKAEAIAVRPGDYVLLTVADDGEGMDEVTRLRVFEPFFTTKGTVATGLGLASVHGIVRQLEGDIRVISEKGKGASFEVFLPLQAPEPKAEDSPTAVPARKHAGDSVTILLVEDDAAVRAATRRILEAHGFDVLEADSGGEAVRMCKASDHPIDLLVTDVVMPGMSGIEVASRLRKSRPGLNVLYVSGYTNETIVRHGAPDNTRFLPKPFTLEALISTVRQALGMDESAHHR